MQTSISMPTILRAFVSLREWANNENEIASVLMEESVSNKQFTSALAIPAGFVLLLFMSVSPVLAVLGAALMIVGSYNLMK